MVESKNLCKGEGGEVVTPIFNAHRGKWGRRSVRNDGKRWISGCSFARKYSRERNVHEPFLTWKMRGGDKREEKRASYKDWTTREMTMMLMRKQEKRERAERCWEKRGS